MLIDSNIIIYAAKAERDELRRFIAQHAPYVSAVSYVEVLGYHRLTEQERQYFTAFSGTLSMLAIAPAVIESAIALRQTRKMALGDALIAGTALAYNLALVTHNVKDFDWINGLTIIDPLV